MYFALLEDRSDEAEFTALYHRYRDRFLNHAYGILKDSHRAEEAVHDAFVALAKNFKKFLEIPRDKQRGYLVIIVENKCKDILRREKKHLVAEETVREDPAAHERAETRAAYRRAVDLIGEMGDPELREILERRLVLEMTNQETAKAMGLSKSAVSRKYLQGLAVLRENMEKEGYGNG